MLAELSVKALTVLLEHFKACAEQQGDSLKSLVMAFYRYYLKYPKYFELFVYMERPDFKSNIQSYLSISSAIKNYFTKYLSVADQRISSQQRIESFLLYVHHMGELYGVDEFYRSEESIHRRDRQTETSGFTVNLCRHCGEWNEGIKFFCAKSDQCSLLANGYENKRSHLKTLTK